MTRSGLAEGGRISRDGNIARPANFLTAGDAHAVDAADDRFLTHQDRIDHLIKKGHIFSIFSRFLGVIFRIFLGIAASAECGSTGAGKNHRDDIACFLRALETGNNAFHHFGGVRVILCRIIKRNPGAGQTLNRFPARV